MYKRQDEETGCYVLQPIANTQQRTIFDSDFMQGQKQEGEGNEDIIDGTYICLLYTSRCV